MKNNYLLLLFILSGYLSYGQGNKTGTLSLVFDNVVGDQDLVLKDKNYTNAAGEHFNVTLFNYFISNIRLIRANGDEHVVPQDQSYFLIRESNPASRAITLSGIPKGKYIAVSFVIGVDSLRNTKNVSERKGSLDVGGEAKDMYWSWNSGYMHLKLEGTSPQIKIDSVRKTQRFAYHIGLFGGYNKPTLNNVRQGSVVFPENGIRISAKSNPEVTIQADVLTLFNGTTQVQIAQNPSVMANPFSQKVADNYVRMFSFKQVVDRKSSREDKAGALSLNVP